MKTIHQNAKNMRAKGLSVNAIAKELGVSKSSVSIWTRDVILTPEMQLTLRANSRRAAAAMCTNRNIACREKRYLARCEGKKIDLNDPLVIAGLSLYWGEGHKWSGFAALTNADKDLVCLFVRFLREKMGISDDKILIRVTCHSEEQIAQCENLWLEWLRLPKENLRKGTIVPDRKSSRKGKVLTGMCRVEIYDVLLLEKLLGGIEAMQTRLSNNGNSPP